MELELYRNDVLQTATTQRGTLAVLPVSEKKSQKVVVGDLSGVVQVFGCKKAEVAVSFKTLPTKEQVTAVSLGKAKGQRDRIFVAQQNTVKGISKKGKEFFRFNTQVTETIKKVEVYDKHLWTCAEYIHNHFLDGKDKAFWLSPDRINDAEALPVVSLQDWSPVIACQDRCIRVVNDDGGIIYEVNTASAPTAVKYVPDSHDPHHKFPEMRELLYGTESGALVQLMMGPESAKQGFLLPNQRKLGSITSIFSGVDLSKTGSEDIVVGREDGSVEVYDVDEQGQLQQVYCAKLGESVSTVDGGYISQPIAADFIVQTFTGKIIVYSPSSSGMVGPGQPRKDNSAEVAERQISLEAQIMKLRQEIEQLKIEVEAERQRYARSPDGLVAVQAPFTVQDKCRLEAEEACYVLSIESAVPIFTVALQATLALDLLDVPSNVAIISHSPPDEANNSLTLATYRCQDSTNRLTVKFKVREGRGGTVTAYVLPQISPKTCSALVHKIKPLCLHKRVQTWDESRPTSELLITGTFSFSDVHLWLVNCLPDLPPSLPAGQDNATMYYQNTLLQTQLCIKYRTGEVRMLSDLLTTLGHLHESLMRDATSSKQRVNVAFSPNSAALQHSLKQIWPKLEAQRQLKRKVALLEALTELKMQDGDVSYLSAGFKSILDQGDALKSQLKESPQHLDHLVSLCRDLYVDFCRLTGISTPKARVPQLEQMLLSPMSTCDSIFQFMMNGGTM